MLLQPNVANGFLPVLAWVLLSVSPLENRPRFTPTKRLLQNYIYAECRTESPLSFSRVSALAPSLGLVSLYSRPRVPWHQRRCLSWPPFPLQLRFVCLVRMSSHRNSAHLFGYPKKQNPSLGDHRVPLHGGSCTTSECRRPKLPKNSRPPCDWCPFSPTFWGEGSPAKIDYKKKGWYPHSNLSTGGPSISFLPRRGTAPDS